MTLQDMAISGIGSVEAVVALCWPWPPAQSILFFERKSESGNIMLKQIPSGRLEASLVQGENSKIVESFRIDLATPPIVVIHVNWKEDLFEMYIGEELVGSYYTPLDDSRILKFADNSSPEGRLDFSTENEQCVRRRISTKGGTHPLKGRKKPDDLYNLSGLKDAILATADMIDAISQDKLYALKPLTNQVRLLMADTNNPTGGLLQWCAAILQAPLIIFTCHNPRAAEPAIDWGVVEVGLDINGALTPTPILQNPVDLDIWLGFQGVQLSKQRFTNRECIHKIGSSIGSHFDPSQHPVVENLRSLETEIGLLQIRIDHLTHYIVNCAIIGGGLGVRLLESAGYNFP